MQPVNTLIASNMERMKACYRRISTAPQNWKETPRPSEIWLERELASLHDWIRIHHNIIANKVEVSEDMFKKIMNACHIVV